MCSCNIVLIVFALLGIVLIVLGSVLGFVLFPSIIDDRITESVRLINGTDQFERWQSLPFPLTFKVYFFDVKNPDEITNNFAVPEVEEKGPYVYKQWRHKENIAYNENEDVLSYKQILNFEFDDEASGSLTEDDVVTVLNVPLQGIFQINTDNPALANSVWRRAFPNTTTLFHSVSVKDYLFNGYSFCSKKSGITEIILNTFCDGVKSKSGSSKTLTVVDDMVVFSFFNHKNNTDDGVYEIKAGNNDVLDVGEIIGWEQQDYLSAWIGENSTCNRIRGRDSSIFPPFNDEDSLIEVFNTDICRIVRLDYEGTAEFKGIEGHVRRLGREAMYNTGDQECYCTKQTKNLYGELECLPEGFGDMQSCLGAPVITSFPHLLWADESYQQTVIGLTPDEDKHSTFVNIEPATGSPLNGAKRLQFNMFIQPIDKIAITQNVTPSVMPIIWVEEGVELSDDLIDQLQSDYFDNLVMLDAITWVLISVGIVMFVGCSGYYVLKRR